MTTSFPRTIGPKADVAELEYIAALHQTCAVQTRATGTISSLDIQRFLQSRYALTVSHSQARDIVRGLGGGGGAESSLAVRQSVALRVADRMRREAALQAAVQAHHASKWRVFSSSSGGHHNSLLFSSTHATTTTATTASASHRRARKAARQKQSELLVAQALVEEALNPKILYLDLVQIASILIMPTVLRMGRAWTNQHCRQNQNTETEDYTNVRETEPHPLAPPTGVLETVLHTLWNVAASHPSPDTFDDNDNNSNNNCQDDNNQVLAPRLTPELIHTLLVENGELERAKDVSLIQTMLQAASTPTGRLDMPALIQAMTSDLHDYQIGWEDQVSSFVEDIFGVSTLENIKTSTVHDLSSMHNGDIPNRQQQQQPPQSQPLQSPQPPQVDQVVAAPADDTNIDCEEQSPLLLFGASNADNHGGHNVNNSHCDDDEENADNNDKDKPSSTNQDNNHDNLDKNNEDSSLLSLSSTSKQEATATKKSGKSEFLCDTEETVSGLHNHADDYQENIKDNNDENNIENEEEEDDDERDASNDGTRTSSSNMAQRKDAPAPANRRTNDQAEGDEGDKSHHSQYDACDQNYAVGSETTPPHSWNNDTNDIDNPNNTKLLPNTELQEQQQQQQPYTTKAAQVIDSVVDSYGSTATNVLIWMTYIVFSASYIALVLRTKPFVKECPEKSFSCSLLKTVLSWMLVALLLSGFGLTVLLPLAYGNHPTKRGPKRMFLATLVPLVLAVVPAFVIHLYGSEERQATMSEDVKRFAENGIFKMLVNLSTALSSALALNYFFYFAIGMARKCNLIRMAEMSDRTNGGILGYLCLTSDVRGTARSKKAGTRKVNRMLKNARNMHGTSSARQQFRGSTASEQANRESINQSSSLTVDTPQIVQSDLVFQNFTLRGEAFEDCGSLAWTWRNLLNGELFDVEGIWLPSRLWVFQLGMVVIGIVIVAVFFHSVELIAELAEEAQSELDSHRYILDRRWYPEWVYDIVPTGAEVRKALYPAASVATIVCMLLTLIYLPSTVKTILKYRCGQIPALGSPDFHAVRKGADKAYMNTANAIYGMVAGSALFYFLIGLVLFLFFWEFSRESMLLLLAWFIGLMITILLKTIVTTFCRKKFFRAFYRVYPWRANVASLALECWFIGLGGGILVGRLTQFLLASAFWIGRIDEPFLAPNVALLGIYKFDYIPLNYLTEILVHEAHRHPYLERLGGMYLMRLRHTKSFGSDAGGCWRQLFVLTLMPWLLKYRVFHEQRCVESVKDQETEREVEIEEDQVALKDVAKEILGSDSALANAGVALADKIDQGAKTVGRVGFEVVETGVELLHFAEQKSGGRTLQWNDADSTISV